MKKKAYDKAFNFNRMCTDENTKQMIQQILHNFEFILESCRSLKGGWGELVCPFHPTNFVRATI